jgi:hypothetical protein
VSCAPHPVAQRHQSDGLSARDVELYELRLDDPESLFEEQPLAEQRLQPLGEVRLQLVARVLLDEQVLVSAGELEAVLILQPLFRHEIGEVVVEPLTSLVRW